MIAVLGHLMIAQLQGAAIEVTFRISCQELQNCCIATVQKKSVPHIEVVFIPTYL